MKQWLHRKKRWHITVFFITLILAYHITYVSPQLVQLATIRSILNDIWDKANNRLMTTNWVGAQQAIETEITIWNDVWDKVNHKINTSGGAGGSPGGADTQVQFNDAGAFGGDAGLTYNKTTDTLTGVTFVGALTGNASTATALVANPTDCAASNFATASAANGDLTCTQPTLADVAAGSSGSGTYSFSSATLLRVPQKIEWTEAAGDPACAAGDFFIAANATSNIFRKCQNGSISDLDTGGAGGDSISVNGVSAIDADFDDATPAAPANAVNVKWQKDALTPNNVSAHLLLTDIDGAGLGVSGTELITASNETNFLTSGALTCGASTQGKMQVHTTPLQYCDNAATPALQYAAYGGSTGIATSATALATNPTDCGANTFATTIAANGDLTCATPALGTDTSGNYVADVTAGAGLTKTSSASEGQTVDLAVLSTEAGFLTDGGTTALTCGSSNQGKMQVMDNGDLQYCDGATTSVVRRGAHYVIHFGSSGGTTDQYIAPSNNLTSGTATNIDSAVISPSFAATCRNLTYRIRTAAGGGLTWTGTIYTGPVGTPAATALTCVITDPAKSCTDTTNTITIAAAESVMLLTDTNGAPASSAMVNASIECVF